MICCYVYNPATKEWLGKYGEIGPEAVRYSWPTTKYISEWIKTAVESADTEKLSWFADAELAEVVNIDSAGNETLRYRPLLPMIEENLRRLNKEDWVWHDPIYKKNKDKIKEAL